MKGWQQRWRAQITCIELFFAQKMVFPAVERQHASSITIGMYVCRKAHDYRTAESERALKCNTVASFLLGFSR
jgi:hypothetical protein